MARKLHNILIPQSKYLLEFSSNLHQSFSSGTVPILAPASRLCPQANPEECFTDVDHDTHYLLVILGLEGLANGGQHNVEPELVNRHGTFVFELEGPFATVLILDILPFRADTSLEEVVVGFEGKVVCFSNIILLRNSDS